MRIAVSGGTKNIKILKTLFKEDVEITCFIDNNPELAGAVIEDIKVYSPYDFPVDTVDYIIVFIYDYEKINQELVDLGVNKRCIINFNDERLDFTECEEIFHSDIADKFRMKLKLDDLNRKIRVLENNLQWFQQNYVYEVVSQLENREIVLPVIHTIEETIEKIICEKCSLSRYGDGEFEIILGHAKDIYQSNHEKLAERLKEILKSSLQKHIVALADDYGEMRGLRSENKNTIRRYMTEEKRSEHYSLLDMDKDYYNAYISRPYVIYPHNEVGKASKRFKSLQRIWDKQNVLFVEGDKTRMGVGNDLFRNAEKIERIIAPNENAFDVYDKILNAALKYGKDRLILIALGPTATVLAYDLAEMGYWALDIGHLDLEYEWFLKGKGYSYVPHKYNNEALGDTKVQDIYDEYYEETIIETIGIS